MNQSISDIIGVTNLNRKDYAETIFITLRNNILSGKLQEGYQFPSQEILAGQFGVSRAVIREAFKKLSSFGLVESYQGRGSFVCAPEAKTIVEPMLNTLRLDETSVRELMETRFYVEVITASLSATRASATEVEKLEETVQFMEANIENGHLEEFTRNDISFHLTLADSSKNGIFARVLETIRDTLHQLMLAKFIDGAKRDLRTTERAASCHRKILEAVKEKNPDKAGQEMRNHLEDIYEAVSGLIGYNLEIPVWGITPFLQNLKDQDDSFSEHE